MKNLKRNGRSLMNIKEINEIVRFLESQDSSLFDLLSWESLLYLESQTKDFDIDDCIHRAVHEEIRKEIVKSLKKKASMLSENSSGYNYYESMLKSMNIE